MTGDTRSNPIANRRIFMLPRHRAGQIPPQEQRQARQAFFKPYHGHYWSIPVNTLADCYWLIAHAKAADVATALATADNIPDTPDPDDEN